LCLGLLGPLIMTKAAFQVVLAALLALSAWHITAGVSRAVDGARREVEVLLKAARNVIGDMKGEGVRLMIRSAPRRS
jgi:hypothetical protein